MTTQSNETAVVETIQRDEVATSAEVFWMLLSGGYVGTILFNHPVYQRVRLSIQQFADTAESYGIALFNPDNSDPVRLMGDRTLVIEELMKGEMIGTWAFLPVNELSLAEVI